jgi:hypothetical protein
LLMTPIYLSQCPPGLKASDRMAVFEAKGTTPPEEGKPSAGVEGGKYVAVSQEVEMAEGGKEQV